MSGLAESPWLMKKDNLMLMKITLSARMKLVICGGSSPLSLPCLVIMTEHLRLMV